MIDVSTKALEQFPPSMVVEDYDGDRFVDDEYGYDEAQRKAFVLGADWAFSHARVVLRAEALVRAADDQGITLQELFAFAKRFETDTMEEQ